MKFYSGFSFSNEEELFASLIKDSEYTVCGFSYGAIKAFKHVQESLKKSKRIDTLQLFSPAFFQTKSDKFKRLQTLSYSKNNEKYLSQFRESCFLPYEIQELNCTQTSLEDLEELLQYEWSLDALKDLESKGVIIEVYLGGEDAIIDVAAAQELFLEVATVTYIKNANHCLQIN
ncbi:MAG: pimelyl-ACP methyl ester esterase BioV [Helicobacteraceae bacterium]|nr:pimelyl-ACP methyl ester esterase BioV [Candidatus Sulfurimonas ponti]MBL6973141.1 pimelyl-ACP methyl ester esterase BioV [Sulfurimonas sp.]